MTFMIRHFAVTTAIAVHDRRYCDAPIFRVPNLSALFARIRDLPKYGSLGLGVPLEANTPITFTRSVYPMLTVQRIALAE